MLSDEKTKGQSNPSEALIPAISSEQKLEHKLEDNFWPFFRTNIKRTIPTALSFDFSIGLPVLEILMTHLDHGESAPSVTTLLNIVGYLQFAAVIPTSMVLGEMFGKLENLETQLDTQKKLTADIKTTSTDEKSPNTKLDFKKDSLDAKQAENTLHELNTEISSLKRKIGRTPKNGMIAGLIGTSTVVILVFAKDVLLVFRQKENVAEDGEIFFRSYAPFFLAVSPRLVMEFVLLTSKKQQIAMLIADAALLCTIGLEYGLGFETPLNLRGLGIGVGAGAGLTSLGFTTYVVFNYQGFGFLRSFFSWIKEDAQQIKEFLKIAGLIIVTVISDISATFAVTLMAGTLPGKALDLQNIATAFLNMNTLVTAAASQTTSIMVAEQKGKAESGGATNYSIILSAKAGFLANTILQLPLVIFAIAGPNQFAQVVGENSEESITEYLLLITAAYALIDGLRYNMLQTSRTLGDNLTPSIVTNLALWLGVGSSYLLSNYTSLGVLGLPIGLTGGALAGTLYLGKRLRDNFNALTAKDDKQNASQGKVTVTVEKIQDVPSNKSCGSWYDFFRCRRNAPPPYTKLPEAQPDQKSEKSICIVM